MLESIKSVQWSAIFVEEGKLSMGRVMGWVVFFLLMYIWVRGMDMPPALLESFWGLLLYNGGKKATGPVADYFKSKGGIVSSMETPSFQPTVARRGRKQDFVYDEPEQEERQVWDESVGYDEPRAEGSVRVYRRKAYDLQKG